MSTALMNGGEGGQGNQAGGNAGGGDGSGSGGGAGGGAGAAGGSGGAGNQGGAAATWRDTLPDDLKANPGLQMFTDVGALAKSYLETKAHVGKKGVIVPGANASDEEWSRFAKEIGVPEADKYDVKVADGKPIPPEFVGKFKEMALKSGLLPRQAQGIMDFITQSQEEAVAAHKQQHDTTVQNGLKELRKEWGQGWDKELSYAKLAAKEAGILEHLDKSGAGNDPLILKALATFGKLYGEDRLRGEGGGSFGKTPAEIDKEINGIMGNTGHPYWNASHPGHKGAVAEMEALQKAKHESQKAG
jgi:hypothetical protein